MDEWKQAQEWEADWHGNCINSLGEELKQLTYAKHMGISRTPNAKTAYAFDGRGKRILDIGGGAYSLLLKCENLGFSIVTDPLMNHYPEWVRQRYLTAQIMPFSTAGEDLLTVAEFGVDGAVVDEVWIYNVLQHTRDPEKIIKNAKHVSKIVRIFEWIDTGTNIGHLHSLKARSLDKWLGGEGSVRMVNENGAVGKSYAGIFKGDNYEEV